MTSKSLKFFKFEFDVHDYVPEIYTSANFHFTHSGGLLTRWVKYYGFVTFFMVIDYTVLSRARAQVKSAWMDIHGLWLIRCVFAHGRSFWGLRQYRNSFGVIAPKTPPKGA